MLLSPLKSRKRHRNRHHGGGGSDREMVPARLFPSTSGPTGEALPGDPSLCCSPASDMLLSLICFSPPVSLLTTGGSVSTSPLSCELNTAITCREDIAPPPILPRRHTHPPPGSAKQSNQREGRHRRRHRTTSTRSESVTTSVQPTKFQTPLVGGARGSR